MSSTARTFISAPYYAVDATGTPYSHGHVARYDTTAFGFADSRSWSTFDTTTVSPNAQGFNGNAFDGRYVYFVPNGIWGSDGTTLTSLMLRYDTQSPFTSAQSWETFDAATLDSTAAGFNTAAFDGRYVIYVPAYAGTFVRFDTQGSFADPTAWTAWHAAALDAGAGLGFYGAAFDGEYLYVAPDENAASVGSIVVARFDAKVPAFMPKLPAFFGSFY